jgi:hypothetical protein
MNELLSIIDAFKKNVDAETLKLPPMPFEDRKIVHEYVEKLGLYTYSTGGGDTRYITVTKQVSCGFAPKACDIKMFIRDYQLPIPIHESPYFMHFIKVYNAMDKYKMFVESIKLTHSLYGKSLKDYSFKLQKEVVASIRDSPGYQRLTKDKTWLDRSNLQSIHETHIYSRKKKNDDSQNITKYYISIDIIKANYNTMRSYDPSIFKDTNSWEDFMATFTTVPYFINSKFFRQIIFGNLSLKNFWRKFLDVAYKLISPHFKILGKVSDDELIIEVAHDDNILDDATRIKELLDGDAETKHMWRVTPFSLCLMEESHDVYIKHNYLTNTDEIKNCDKDLYAQYYKKHFKLLTHPFDFKALKNDLVITYGPIF